MTSADGSGAMLVRLRDVGPGPAAAASAADILSVIVPVLHDGDDELVALYRAYRDALAGCAGPVEFIYVLAPGTPRAQAALRALKDAGDPLVIVRLSQSETEAAALRSGLEQASGATVLTLSAYPQVEAAELPRVLEALDACDMVVARRSPFASTAADNVQSAVFHWLIRKLFGRPFGDLVCRVRAGRRQVFEEVAGYGTQHHFLPLLAAERGFRIREIDVRQLQDPRSSSRSTGLFTRLRLTLDILALFVVLKFIRKPLRFFGAVGLPILLLGLIHTGTLGIARLFFGVPLADRPALILGVLLLVLGIQIVALGLIGEIIIFASGKRIKDYTVEKVL